MTAARLRLSEPLRKTTAPQRDPTVPRPLSEAVGTGKLLEISGDQDAKLGHARTSAAVAVLRDVQRAGETTAWIQPRFGPLYPPDLAECGIDLDALLVVHVPPPPGARSAREHPHALCKAAELLLRSGGFGLVVLDFCQGAPPRGSEAWQGRLLGLARQHHSHVLMLTEKNASADSLGTLVGLRIEPRRYRSPDRDRESRRGAGAFTVEHAVLKNKSGATVRIEQDARRGPWGMR